VCRLTQLSRQQTRCCKHRRRLPRPSPPAIGPHFSVSVYQHGGHNGIYTSNLYFRHPLGYRAPMNRHTLFSIATLIAVCATHQLAAAEPVLNYEQARNRLVEEEIIGGGI